MNEIKIEKGVPFPVRKTAGLSAALRKCEVGDSFVFPKKASSGCVATASRLGMKITQRTLSENEVRIWRVA